MSDYDAIHAERYRLSLEAVSHLLTGGARVVELGGDSPFTAEVVKRGCQLVRAGGDSDLRAGFRITEKADLILCMEVIEHLADQDTLRPVGWTGSGATALLASCFESLRPGGALFLTTPNACSYRVIMHALLGGAPMHYRPHVREYTMMELLALLATAGFNVMSAKTREPWRPVRDAELHALCARWPDVQRGEDIFIIAQRP